MGFTKIETLSLTDLFVQQIQNMILSGELEVGERLPPARELSLRMGVSRPVISAGLVELEKLGFVEIRPRQGVYVSDYRRRGTVETLVAIMRYNGGALRRGEVKALLEVREALELLCLRLVLDTCGDEELETLSPLLEAVHEARNHEDAAEKGFLFHHELAVLSGNVLLPLLYYSFKPQSEYLWGLYCKRAGIEALYRIKLALYSALLNRDYPETERLTREVLERAMNDLSFYGA